MPHEEVAQWPRGYLAFDDEANVFAFGFGSFCKHTPSCESKIRA